MSAPEDVLARLEALESRIAHQDAVIEDLNGALLAQWQSLEAALRRLGQLEERLRDAESRAGRDAAEAPPPHY